MTICLDCDGEGIIYELSLRGKTWVRTQSHVCTRCRGSGKLALEATCRYCGKPSDNLDNGYCSDVCEFASGQPKVVKIARYGIHCQVSAPAYGWTYGESVTVIRKGYAIEIRPALGGHTCYSVRPKGASVGARVIVVEKPSRNVAKFLDILHMDDDKFEEWLSNEASHDNRDL